MLFENSVLITIQCCTVEQKIITFCSINIIDRPDPPVGKPAVTSITHKSIVLSWSGSSYDGGCPILYYKIECSEGLEIAADSWKVITENCQVI